MSKRFWISIACVFALLIALGVVFYFYDLNISKTLATSDPSFFIKVGKTLGHLPVYFGPLLFGLVYYFTSDSKIQKIIYLIIGYIATFVMNMEVSKFGIRAFSGIIHYDLNLFQYVMILIGSGCIYYLLYMLFSSFKADELIKLRDISFIYMIVSLTSFISVEILKRIWSRPRYITNEYRNFLTINNEFRGLGDDFYSFPSGHCASAATCIVIGLIPIRYTNKKWVHYLVNSLCFVFPFVVAFTRIRMGEHFASDALMGITIVYLYFFITYFIFYKKRWLNVRSNKC